MPVPLIYRSGTGALINYNAFEINSGTGIIPFYAGITVDDDILSTIKFYSNTTYQAALTGEPGSYTKIFERDFDVLINNPLTIRGLGIVNIPLGYQNGGAASGNVYAVAVVRSWDGATETDIVTNQSSTISRAGSGLIEQMLAVDLNIPKTTFKKGEYMRLTIEVWSQGGSNPSVAILGFDPMARGITYFTGSVPSILTFQVPVELEL